MVVMKELPSSTEMQRAFQGRNPASLTRSMSRQATEEERRGRLMRDAQVHDNCRFDTWITATFTSEDSGVKVSDWIEFAQLRFTQKPSFTTGSQRVKQADETPPLAPDAANFDATLHFTVPGTAMVAAWKQDDRGFYVGAKVFLFAQGSVPDGYSVEISAVWQGPAIRSGG